MNRNPEPHAGPVPPGLALALGRLPRRPRDAETDYEVFADPRATCLRFRVSGSPSLEQLVSALHVLGLQSESSALLSGLLDLRHLQTVYSRGDLVRVGHEIACSFPHLAKVALLVAPQRVTRISERAARRAGVNMRVFDSLVQAVEWLDAAQSAFD